LQHTNFTPASACLVSTIAFLSKRKVESKRSGQQPPNKEKQKEKPACHCLLAMSEYAVLWATLLAQKGGKYQWWPTCTDGFSS
jgi:hypothetical protein